MFSKWVSLSLALAALRVSADAASDEAALVKSLRDAPTAVDRINLLPNDEDFEFDFFDPAKAATVGAGGKIVTANSASFPAVIGTRSAMAIGVLDACSMNTPHTHPRATEMQYSVNGTIRTGMITENGGRFIMTELPPGSMTIFPKGSVHFQVNDGCDPLLFVSSFNSEDPGVLSIAQRFLGLPPDIVGATLGGLGVEEVAGLESQIPDNVAIGTDACLKRCGLTRPYQPTTQRQPRVSGNAFPPQVSSSYSYDTYNSGYQYKSQADPAKGYSTTTKYGGDSYTTTATTVYTSYPGSAYPTSTPSPVNHLIKVGLNSTGGAALLFTPSNISAAIGDTVTFEFHAKNHTVTQSSFLQPCKPLAETSTTGQIGFKSGFVPVSVNQTSDFPDVPDHSEGRKSCLGVLRTARCCPPVHCTSGMVFAINAVESSPNNFAAFLHLAETSGISSSVKCPPKDKTGSPLTASSTTTDEAGNVFATCTYTTAGVCTFFSDGSFSSGSSDCPQGLPQASGFGTQAAETGRPLAGDLAAVSDSSTNNDSNKPSAVLIALVAINGALLIGLIVFGTLYFRQRSAAARTSRHKQLYTSLSASGDPVFVAPTKLTQYEEKEGYAAASAGDDTPLTHGLTHGPYYDPHEPATSPAFPSLEPPAMNALIMIFHFIDSYNRTFGA
ncbi:RmlC-like cupin [Mycena sanguinolenta]|uniref:RmlC-like cupin n=1 Tax=Mycena sanguinolenta TaxID=230812 RepID=A0A8H6XDX8_9AGAR|nr:RmlC-like cupin [Mycena sanguinolenta]